MVICTVSDSIIWNIEQFVIDLTVAAQQGPVDINMKQEGPCCQTIKLDDLLGNIPGLTLNAIHTSNQIQSSNFKEIRMPFVELPVARQKISGTRPSTSSLTHRFALFVGRSNWQRLGLASHLWKHYNKDLVITYHYNKDLDYHTANFGLETLLQKQWDRRHAIYEFIEHLPITFDQQTYPILWNERAFDLTEHYKSVFCEIVCETFFSGKTFMMTEKIMRPIIQRRPFVVQGPKFFLENLKRLGFKTFDAWWSEGYDLDDPDAQANSIRDTIDYIGKQSSQTIHEWYQQMQATLTHNANVLARLNSTQITTTEFKSE